RRQVIVGPPVERRDLLLFLVADREDEDRGVPLRPEAAGDLDAVAIGQPEVQDDDIRTNGGGRRHRGSGGAGFEDREGLFPKHDAQKTPEGGIIVDNEDSKAVGAHRRHTVGMLTLTTMPPPSRRAAQMRPLWASTNPVAMVRPS